MSWWKDLRVPYDPLANSSAGYAPRANLVKFNVNVSAFFSTVCVPFELSEHQKMVDFAL